MRVAQFPRLILPVLAMLLWGTTSNVPGWLERFSIRPIYHAGLKGEVQASIDSIPVSGAQISVPDLGLSVITDHSGQFDLRDIPLGEAFIPITITVSAPGFADWAIQNVILSANDTLIITPQLNDKPFRVMLPLPGPTQRWINSGEDWEARVMRLAGAQPPSLPEKIRVRMTGKWQCDLSAPYKVVTLDFKEYVKHVLPNEWYYFWPRESLKAGAMAVKMYAWFFIEQGGKWADADVFDNTCDQWYLPFLTRESTNQAVESTWNWRLTRNGALFPTYHKDIGACDPPFCMRQAASALLARQGYTWDRILSRFYTNSRLEPLDLPPAGNALRFSGSPGDGLEANRLVFRLDEPQFQGTITGVDVGREDFTVEWWMKAFPGENRASSIGCGPNENWIYGNIILDRSRPEDKPGFGVSLTGGRILFGVTGPSGRSLTICGSAPVDDGRWHHIAIQRRAVDGLLWLFVDGKLSASRDGPAGDISYPDGYISEYPDREPVLSFGGWKGNPGSRSSPFFNGWIDEIRFSRILRYSAEFSPPEEIYQPDDATLALYHLDEGLGMTIHDAAERAIDGILMVGGSDAGPNWTLSSLFTEAYQMYLPSIRVNLPER